MDLAALGWNPFFAEAFAALAAPDLVPARVVNEDKHHYTIVGEAGPVAALIPGRLLHPGRSVSELPKVGDWVAVAALPGENKAVIRHLLPRRTHITRKVTGRQVEEQVLATNVDTAFVTQALDATFNLRRLERFLVMVHEGGARPVVVLNKADVCGEVDVRTADARRSAGEVAVRVVSAKTGQGVELLREFVQPGRTVVFLGTSGVGKSSLINRLYGEDIQPTIEVRGHDSKGRHTTSARELLLLPGGGLVIDTPGLREFQMWEANEGLDETFPDVVELGAGCQFRDCRHESEMRCAVKAAVEEGRLVRGRYDSFLKLQRELSALTESRRRHAHLVNKRRARPGPEGFRPEDFE